MGNTVRFVLFLVFVVTGGPAHAQTPRDSITLGGTTLRLGATQASVLQQLGEDYDLSEVKGSGPVSSWLVEEKVTPKDLVANVWFRNGKLNGVSKYWTLSEPETGAAFANDLYGAVLNFEQEGRTLCTIQTGRKREPKFDTRTIFLTCGAKYLRVDINATGGQQISANVSEVMESPNHP